MKKKYATLLMVGLLSLGVASGAQAAMISWTDWTSADASQAFGTLDVGGTDVDVTFTGSGFSAQTAGGTNYWTNPATYTGSALVDNAPPASDIIRLNTGGQKNISFSQAVVDPIFALVSWNGNTVDFGTPIEILSYGQGYWGNGTPILNAGGTGFYGSGEVHGAIRLPGTFTSINFTDTSENWHGFTLGVAGLGQNGPSPVPAPIGMLLLGSGLAGLIAVRRRQQ